MSHFRASVSRLSKVGKMKRAGGKLAMSMARKQGDPLIKQRDAMKKRLFDLNNKLRMKYSRKAMMQVRRMG